MLYSPKISRFIYDVDAGVSFGIFIKDEDYYTITAAFTHQKDQFCKEVGRKICGERFAKSLLDTSNEQPLTEDVHRAVLGDTLIEAWQELHDIIYDVIDLYRPQIDDPSIHRDSLHSDIWDEIENNLTYPLSRLDW